MKYLASLALILVFFSQTVVADDAKSLRIVRTTPAGTEVTAGHQIVFQFNRPVVPIGRMERDASEIPVETAPNLQCKWRWLNTSALACQLDNKNKLQKATQYNLTMKPGIMAEDGATIPEEYIHNFTTTLPDVRYTSINKWLSPTKPSIYVRFNQPVTKSSVEQNLFFTYDDKYYDINVESSENSWNKDAGETKEARIKWLASPKEELPSNSNVEFKIKAGLVSNFGNKASIDNRMLSLHDTFSEFKFLGVSCQNNNKERMLITKENFNDIGKCDPLSSISLTFSSPVLTSQIAKNVIITPELSGGKKDYNPWANSRDFSRLQFSYYADGQYKVWIPEFLKADSTYTIKSKKNNSGAIDKIQAWFTNDTTLPLQDEFGRTLKEPIDITFYTDNRTPNFKLAHQTAVLEQQTDSDIPLYVNNIDNISFNYKSLTSNGAKDNQHFSLNPIPKVKNIQFAVPMQIRDMLGGKSGIIYGKIEETPRINGIRYGRDLLAIVTPYQIHAKIGHYNSLIWVTDLATGEPVTDANVRIYIDDIHNPKSEFHALDEAKTDSSGRAILSGHDKLNLNKLFGRCYREECERLILLVDKQDNMAIMPLNSRFEINSYRASNYRMWANLKKKHGHIHSWGTTAQGIYRAGGNIQYKLYVRDQNNANYIPAPKSNYKLEIIDPTGKIVHTVQNIALSDFGSYNGEYTLPETAAIGWYNFKLSGDFTDYTWSPIRVLVSDFTPAPFKVTNNINGDLFHSGDQVTITTNAKLHSGGAYGNTESRVTAIIKERIFSSNPPIAQDFAFDSYKNKTSDRVFQKIETISDSGESEHIFTLPESDIIYGRLTAESAVRDDRGKYIATNSGADYIAVDRLVGLKHTKWLYEADTEANIKYIVVDGLGTPKAGTKVDLKIERLDTKSAKVKGAGNSYITNYVDEWIETSSCSGISSLEPLTCSFTPKQVGIYKITSNIVDTKGRQHSSTIRAWVTGSSHVVWHEPNDNSLQIIPEKHEYHIGDKARYLIKNPYPGAKALVSIERYGILKSWVQELDGSTPVIEFEIEKDFMPGFYLSVTVTSPRTKGIVPAVGQIDLGKPAFKIGYIQVPVKDPYKQINVSVETDSPIYKPRDKVNVKIHAEPRHKDKVEPIELAVVVLDESVLDLVKNGEKSFDPYEGFYKLDNLDLINYNLLTRLIGRQKFEKKGANPGGDGGSGINMRSLFKYISYWNPSIKTDANGDASLEFEVPDNLTGWRVLAFAVTPTDRMGLGYTNFKTNLPTEIRPTMPNQVTKGDKFQAGFSVMNRTNNERTLDVTISVRGLEKKHHETIILPAYKRKTVFMPIEVTSNNELYFTAIASDEIDSDAIEHKVPVRKRHSLIVAANYGSTSKNTVTESLHFPKNIHPDVGNVSVTLSSSIISNIDDAFRYIRDYPYSCWEQRLTMAVMSSNYQGLQSYLSNEFKWDNSSSIPNGVLNKAANYQANNGGMAYFVPTIDRVSPYLSAYTAIAFNWLRDNNYNVPRTVENKLHTYLANMLKKDLLPSFYSAEMSATVRAVALSALSAHDKVSLSDIERYRLHLKHISLFGKAHYLQAALKVKGAESIAKEITESILAHANQSSGKFSFNEEIDTGFKRILDTPLKANCAILSAFSAYGSTQDGATLIGDVPPKLARTILQSNNKNGWGSTQKNVFCTKSLVDYASVYEKDQPNMNITATLAKEELGRTKFQTMHDDPVTFKRAITANDLGKKTILKLERKGTGQLYYNTKMNYALLNDHVKRLNSGIDIRKEYSVKREDKWVLLDASNKIKRGELVRIDIYVSLPTARNFLVVDDPVPGGLEPVNRDLATSSVIDADAGKFQAANNSWWNNFNDWSLYNSSYWSFYHKELRHDSVRFYSDYLPAGNYHLSYVAQAIASGEFIKMPIHAEEMYEPDIFGNGLSGILKIDEK